jgi:hypothetical protein
LGSRNVLFESEILKYFGILGVAFRRKRLHEKPSEQAFDHEQPVENAKEASPQAALPPRSTGD